MNSKKSIVILFFLLALFIANGSIAQASLDPVYAVNDLFTALNEGEVDQALDVFVEDAVAHDCTCGETFEGANEIAELLNTMAHDGRHFEIVSMTMDGDQVTATIDISDRGHTWAQERIEAVVEDGKVHTLNVISFDMQFDRV